jgi:hypothetical protein
MTPDRLSMTHDSGKPCRVTAAELAAAMSDIHHGRHG